MCSITFANEVDCRRRNIADLWCYRRTTQRNEHQKGYLFATLSLTYVNKKCKNGYRLGERLGFECNSSKSFFDSRNLPSKNSISPLILYNSIRVLLMLWLGYKLAFTSKIFLIKLKKYTFILSEYSQSST